MVKCFLFFNFVVNMLKYDFFSHEIVFDCTTATGHGKRGFGAALSTGKAVRQRDVTRLPASSCRGTVDYVGKTLT